MSTVTHKKMSYDVSMAYTRKISSSNTINRTFLKNDCSLNAAIEMLSGRWTTQVLFLISFGENRFSKLKKKLPGISDQILGLRINHLLEHKLIEKLDSAEDKVYVLTERAEQLILILNKLGEWQGCKK